MPLSIEELNALAEYASEVKNREDSVLVDIDAVRAFMLAPERQPQGELYFNVLALMLTTVELQDRDTAWAYIKNRGRFLMVVELLWRHFCDPRHRHEWINSRGFYHTILTLFLEDPEEGWLVPAVLEKILNILRGFQRTFRNFGRSAD